MAPTTMMITTQFYILLLLGALAGAGAAATHLPQQTAPAALFQESRKRGVIELDLERVIQRRVVKRDEAGRDVFGMTAIGLGDALDITYNVLVQFGNISTPLVLDTGSADLWVLSDACVGCASAPYPLYPSKSLKYVADAQLLYGDSRTGTHAYGIIGADRAGVAGFTLENQYFAAINDTNTSVLDTGSAGIFGLGFPINSILWNELYTMASVDSPPSKAKRQITSLMDMYSRPRSPPPLPTFPPSRNLDTGEDDASDIRSQTNGIDILSTFSLYGPLVSRMVLNDSSSSYLASPQFSVALQRTTPSLSGDVGALTLGGLPGSVENNSLTWTPVRLYTAQQNGVVVPQAPNEIYPYAWDVPLDGVYFDGARLPNSKLGDVSKPGVGQSALIDTGNSLIRGPADVVAAILSLLANSTSSPSPFADSPSSPDESRYSEEEYAEYTRSFNSLAYAYPCAEPHTIEFQFSGKRFAVDPRDFGRPIMGDPEDKWCVPNLAPTDPPEIGGYLYSWSLGEPYLRSVLASFYYGNITQPSQNLPRVGFLSTVPEDAALRLSPEMRSAQSAGGYEETTISAPTGTYTGGPVTTEAHGVVQISEAPLPFNIASSSGAGRQSRQGNGSSRLRSTPLIFGFGVPTCALVGTGLTLLGIWL